MLLIHLKIIIINLLDYKDNLFNFNLYLKHQLIMDLLINFM
jgi:hypothetical protein